MIVAKNVDLSIEPKMAIMLHTLAHSPDLCNGVGERAMAASRKPHVGLLDVSHLDTHYVYQTLCSMHESNELIAFLMGKM